jgi:hypothetical protein
LKASRMPLNSPVRLIPAVGVTTTAPQNATSFFGDPAGAHYRTLSMFFMFQNQSPSFQFDCVPPVVNVAHRKPLGHLSAMLGHELRHELRLNLRYNPLYTFFKRTRHQFLLLARDVIMSGQLTP